jgi:hypothetical protein
MADIRKQLESIQKAPSTKAREQRSAIEQELVTDLRAVHDEASAQTALESCMRKDRVMTSTAFLLLAREAINRPSGEVASLEKLTALTQNSGLLVEEIKRVARQYPAAFRAVFAANMPKTPTTPPAFFPSMKSSPPFYPVAPPPHEKRIPETDEPGSM